jgi:hypothetical protein
MAPTHHMDRSNITIGAVVGWADRVIWDDREVGATYVRHPTIEQALEAWKEGMTQEQKNEYINKVVSEAAYEEVDSSLDWEISED